MSIKYMFGIVTIIIVLLPFNLNAQNEPFNSQFPTLSKKCTPNLNNQYNRLETLERLGGVINQTAVDYYNAKYKIKKTITNPKFVQKDERPIGFFVYDLTDTSNKTAPLGDCIDFVDNHIYHFSLIHTPDSFSHIVFLNNGELKIFKAVNCENGDKIEDVINYLGEKLKNDISKDEILDRVKHYRKYGIYGATEGGTPLCEPTV